MEKECEAIKANALSLAWFTRGAASYEDVLNMSAAEHRAIGALIEKNIKSTEDSGLPFF